MSRHKFIVINLREWKVPLLMFGITSFCFVSYLSLSAESNNINTIGVISHATAYEDGIYKVNLTMDDTVIGLVVTVEDESIVSVNLENFDDKERATYPDINKSIGDVHDYVVSTQSITLPETENISEATRLLMDAIGVALSQEPIILKTTYQAPLLEEHIVEPTK
ncbi:hypothetical protein AN641_09380 [Candidatus Epulonipiscioides gigas]|nr:hypothetical protein AN641_09380 [Epulopiscium sp. SCG-C07WGA-EpuloA2]